MRMGDNVADAVTNDFGRIHDTTNCYIAGPALFPTVARQTQCSRELHSVRRTGDLLNGSVLPGPDPIVSPQSEAGFRPLSSTARLPRSRTGASPVLAPAAACSISTARW